MATRASQHVRYIIVGTKVDLIPGSWGDAQKKLEGIQTDMRSVVLRCCGASTLKLTSVVFVTAMGTHPQYRRLRKRLKHLLKAQCKSIFQGDTSLLKTLRFPQVYIEFQKDVEKLCNLHNGLPILNLESIQGQQYGLLEGCHANAQSQQALRVLHDVGDVIFCNVSDGQGGSKACLCWRPQLVANVIAKFADPDNRLPIHNGLALRAELEDILEEFLQNSSYHQSDAEKSRENAATLFDFLLALRVFVPVDLSLSSHTSLVKNPSHLSSLHFIVPSALTGRPSFWREVFVSEQGQISCLRGVRFLCMDTMITAASFIRAMTQLCSDALRMWGCAFCFQLGNGGHMFVRLAEGRDFVDVVILGTDLSQLVGDCVDICCRQITTMLRCSMDNALLLCPHCCASDMFARSGAVHAFYREQLGLLAVETKEPHPGHIDRITSSRNQPTWVVEQNDSGEATSEPPSSEQMPVRLLSSSASDHNIISCSRYHEVSALGILKGRRVGRVGSVGLPPSYPEGSLPDRNTLHWVAVSSSGLAETAPGEVEVLPNSFFSLSRQLKEGDKVTTESLAAINNAMLSGAKTCKVQHCGKRCDIQLQLEYSVGNAIDGRVIDEILSCSGSVEIKNAAASTSTVTTKRAHQLCVGDKVLLSVSVDSDHRRVEGIRCLVSEVIDNDKLVLERVQSPTAVPLPLAADVCIMPILESFTVLDYVLVVYRRTKETDRRAPFDLFPGATNLLRIARLTPGDCNGGTEAICWRDIEDNWAIMLGTEFQNYEITGMTLFRCEERERLFLAEVERLEIAAPHRPPADFSCSFDVDARQKAERAALQQQVLRQFGDFSQKFSLLPRAENHNVNLSVAWWGKWAAVYHGAAQNGFWNLPTHLKLDPGYFGEGFYLTRYPRYSDYYINGLSLSQRKVSNGNMLMCYAALGRPYPVTQDPFPPPLYTQGPTSTSSLCGKACGPACSISSTGGIESHDCHYATVKMHPKAGQYFPCPLRQQPDFDEIVVFKPERILPAAYVTFERRCCCC